MDWVHAVSIGTSQEVAKAKNKKTSKKKQTTKRDEATRLQLRHRVLRKVELMPSPAGTLLCTSSLTLEKRRKEEKEKERKGREFIPVGMALLVTLS